MMQCNQRMLDPSILAQLLRVEHEIGMLFWKTRPRHFFKHEGDFKSWNTRLAGKQAFSLKPDGYIDGDVLSIPHKAHRVVWALYHGVMPTTSLDHINGNPSDNRIGNLREVDHQANARNANRRRNNKSGVTGVSMTGKRWLASIRHDGRQLSLGTFATIEEAAAARKKAEAAYGYYPTHGLTLEERAS
jgi:hypothetical protein